MTGKLRSTAWRGCTRSYTATATSSSATTPRTTRAITAGRRRGSEQGLDAFDRTTDGGLAVHEQHRSLHHLGMLDQQAHHRVGGDVVGGVEAEGGELGVLGADELLRLAVEAGDDGF